MSSLLNRQQHIYKYLKVNEGQKSIIITKKNDNEKAKKKL